MQLAYAVFPVTIKIDKNNNLQPSATAQTSY